MNKYRIAEKSYLEMEFEKERKNFLKIKRMVEAKKKNNFKSGVNPRKGKQAPTREPLPSRSKCKKSHGSKPCYLGQNVC